MLGIFQQTSLDIKLFNEKVEVVFGAVENDLLTRTEAQDNAVNIIIGAGQFKNKLSAAGVEIYRSMFEKVPQSKKTTFLLVDEYDKIRTLKLETWYAQVNNNEGIWLGSGIGNQSLIATNEVLDDDKKYEFDGLAFMVTDAKYTVIKTVMDGDE